MKGQIITFNAELKPPMYGLPDVVGRVVKDVASKRQSCEDFPLAMALSVLSIAVGNRVKSQCVGYENKTNLWSLIIGPSGKAKSASCEPILRPILEIDAQKAVEYEAEVQKYNAAVAAAKGKKSDIVLPPTKQIILNDTTREARNQAIKDNPHGLLLYHSEWSQYICDLSRYSSSKGEVPEMNALWDNSPLRINRKGEPTITIPNPHLVVFGGLQNDLLRSMLNNPGFLASGFLARFLVYYPEEFPVQDYHQIAPLDDAVQKEWADLVNHIYSSDATFNLTVSPDAEYIYKDFCNHLAALEQSVDAPRAAVLSKLRVNALRLVGLATAVKCYDKGLTDNGNNTVAGIREMSWAIDMCWYYYRSADSMIGRISSESRPMTLKECITRICELVPTVNKTQLAEAVGINREKIHRWNRKK